MTAPQFNKGDRIAVVLVCAKDRLPGELYNTWVVEGHNGDPFGLLDESLASAERLPPKWEPKVGDAMRDKLWHREVGDAEYRGSVDDRAVCMFPSGNYTTVKLADLIPGGQKS